MTIDEHIKFWTDGAKKDLDTAFDVFNIHHFDWAFFIGHLALEKVLKAIYNQNTEKITPPKIHNLRKLAELSKLELNMEQLVFLDKVLLFHIEARYTVEKNELFKIATKEFTIENLDKIKETFSWLMSLIK